MKPPFFVCSRPLRAHSFAGGNGPQRASFFPPPQESQKGSSQTIPHPFLFPQCRDVPLLIVPLFIRGSLSYSQERQPSVRSPQPALLKSQPTRVSSQGWQKNRKLLRKQGDFHSETPNFFSESRDFILERATFFHIARLLCGMARILCCIVLLLLLDCAISFAFPRLTLRSPSNTQVPPSHRSPTTSSSLCLPSVNSLSTTTAAP